MKKRLYTLVAAVALLAAITLLGLTVTTGNTGPGRDAVARLTIDLRCQSSTACGG